MPCRWLRSQTHFRIVMFFPVTPMPSPPDSTIVNPSTSTFSQWKIRRAYRHSPCT